MKTKLAFATLAGLTLLFSACSKDNVTDDVTTVKSSELSVFSDPSSICTYDGVLTAADSASLMAMREEEKLAHDVYVTFYETYGETIFQNIANSEEMHTSAVLNLINGYGLSDPALEGVGNFNDPAFADLFIQLTAEGAVSLVDALKTGAKIEDLDINDLMGLLDETENSDLQKVYLSLLRGSGSHLRAFVTALASLGESYEPQYISTETYDEILSGTNGKYGQGNGQNGSQGNGQRNGQGSNNSYGGSNGTGVCDSTQTGSTSSGGNGYGR